MSEETFDAVAWVKELEDWIKAAINDPAIVAVSDPRLRAIAKTQFELGCMALERALKETK